MYYTVPRLQDAQRAADRLRELGVTTHPNVHATPAKSCGTIHTLSDNACYDLTSRLRPVRRRDKSIQIPHEENGRKSRTTDPVHPQEESQRSHYYNVPLLFTAVPDTMLNAIASTLLMKHNQPHSRCCRTPFILPGRIKYNLKPEMYPELLPAIL